jgi:hypothetical protein
VTNTVANNPPAVAGVVAGFIAATAGLITGITAGPFDVYDAWIVAAGAIVGGIAGRVAQRWTTRYFPPED